LALNERCTHALLLDQDSELAPATVAGLLVVERGLLDKGYRVAAVGVMCVDIKTNVPAVAHRDRLEKVRVPVGSEPMESDLLAAMLCGHLCNISKRRLMAVCTVRFPAFMLFV
jgi:hypothetical protein